MTLAPNILATCTQQLPSAPAAPITSTHSPFLTLVLAVSKLKAIGKWRVITVPSAFTATTGRDHWEVLLRARAIEDQLFVVAANQFGTAPPSFSSWGHSMIVDPWGRVLDVLADGEGHAIADLDLGEVERVRARVPSLASRRDGAYAWPVEAGDRA